MPELPEVETVRRTLEQLILNLKIISVDIKYPKIIHMDQDLFCSKIKDQTVRRFERMGKYLIFILDEDALIIHLRMEGRFYIKHHDDAISKHEHLIFHLSDQRELRYHDVRKFGTMHLIPLNDYKTSYPLSSLGLEPSQISYEDFYNKIKSKNIEIKAAMLDQKIISGLGNIYVDETLYKAKIHPERKSLSISKEEAIRIVDAARWVLKEAILQGGTTIRTFEVLDGVHGRFQNELSVHTKHGDPCPICGQRIIKIKVKGRGTYVCPNCQR